MIMLLRRLALFFALICGAAGAQFPEFAQQYRQRLGGAVDELNTIIARFDADAAQSGLSQGEGIARLQSNSDVFVQGRGDQMKEMVARRDRLAHQVQTFNEDGNFQRLWSLATQGDSYIASRAYQNFEPALPVTSEGVVSALLGFVIGGALLRFLAWPFERWHKHRRLRRVEARDRRALAV